MTTPLPSPIPPLDGSADSSTHRLPNNAFTGAELARALRLLATHLSADQPALVSVAWKHGETRSVAIGQLAVLADPEHITSIAVDWTFAPVLPQDVLAPGAGSAISGRVSGQFVNRRRGLRAWLLGPWRCGRLAVEHGGWARADLNHCTSYLAKQRSGAAFLRRLLLGPTPLVVIYLAVAFGLFLLEWRVYPSGPPFLSKATAVLFGLSLVSAAIYYGIMAQVARGTRLVEPSRVAQWSWLTPTLATALAGPVLVLAGLVLTITTGLLRLSGFFGQG